MPSSSADDHPGNKIPALRFTFEVTPPAGRRTTTPTPAIHADPLRHSVLNR
jgi:hypothetical protein